MRVQRIKVFAIYAGFAVFFAAVFSVMFVLLCAAVIGVPSGIMLGFFGAAMLLFRADFIVTDLSPTMLFFGGTSAAFFSAACGFIAVKAGISAARLFGLAKRRCDRLRGW